MLMRSARVRSILATLIFLAVLVMTAIPAAARPRYSEWATPVWAGAALNSSALDYGPGVARDGLTLYITSTRPGGAGGEDIWVSHRAVDGSTWDAPVNLTPLNTTANDRVPALSRDGHWMFFASTRAGGSGNHDLWVSYRPHTDEDFGEFGWQTPVNLTALNTSFYDLAPAYFIDDTGIAYLFFASNRPGGAGDYDIYVATQQADGTFGDVVNVAAINTAGQDARPTISHDGLEIIFHRTDVTGTHLWSSTRASVGAPWNDPVKLTNLSGPGADVMPALSADGTTLFFASTRPGGSGLTDLWMSTRTKETGKP